jgi:pimeloyl-ACP methyl ester carboxylesterase
MHANDDDLRRFEAEGAGPLPSPSDTGHVEHGGARIWYAAYGAGSPVILLHGALGNGDDWGHQVRALVEAGYRPILIDSRGRGRSTRGTLPLGYELMASEVQAVMDALQLDPAAVVGWSDGAIIGLVLAMTVPARVTRVFFFAANMDLSGAKPFSPDPVVSRVVARAAKDYARLSAAPAEFETMSQALGHLMATQPNYSAADLARIDTRVAVVDGENDEFIKRDHIEYLARTIPGARLILLPGVGHFAPLQRPSEFNQAMLAFLDDEPAA